MQTRTFLTAIVTAALVAASSAWAGSLTPPVGPVAPTMKTLQEVEPRTPVQSLPGNATAMFVITQPGSYYLTANIDAAFPDVNAIEIFSDNVSLDLSGFTISGLDNNGVRSGTSGVVVNSSQNREGIAVFNGTVTGWKEHGVVADTGIGARYHDLSLVDCGFDGLRAGYAATVARCSAKNIGFSGFWLFGGGSIANCTARDCADRGFRLDTGGSATNCAAESCNVGFAADNGASFTACTASYCNTGFSVGDGATLTSCTAFYNNVTGIFGNARNHFINCTASNNTGTGLAGNQANTFKDCVADGNASTGILISGTDNTVDGCRSHSNAFGVFSFVQLRNLVIRSRVYGNGTDFSLGAFDYLAPVLTPADLATNTNPNANFGF